MSENDFCCEGLTGVKSRVGVLMWAIGLGIGICAIILSMTFSKVDSVYEAVLVIGKDVARNTASVESNTKRLDDHIYNSRKKD